MPKRGENIYLRKDKRWEGRYKSGYRSDGTAKYSSIYGKTCREVREKLFLKRQALAESETDCNLTIEKLSQIWISAIKHNVKESTLSAYIIKLQKHIIPSLGKVKFKRLTAENISQFADEKVCQGLSVKYVSDILAVLKAMFRYLHRFCNYADKSLLIMKLKCDVPKKTLDFDEAMQTRLRKHLAENPDCSNAGILLAMTTGIRIGELCGLKWGDIDFEKRILTVRRTVQRISSVGGATKIIVNSPKSKSSVRVIHLSEFLLSLMEKFKRDDDIYIMSGRTSPVEARTVRYRFDKILKRLDLPHINFHSLRHIFATKCIEVGFDVKTLSEILGHSSVELTLNRYVHSSMERKEACMKRYSECVFG